MYAGFTKQGGVDESSYVVGHWSEILATPCGGADVQIGNCPDGTLEVSREYYMHEDTSLPKKVDAVAPIRTGMKFSGVVEEIHRRNVSWLLGQSLAPSSNYIYVGAMGPARFFTLRGRRHRHSDNMALEFCIWKVMVTSMFTLASSDEANGSPLECTGIDDTDGDCGGDANGPLGYIWAPTPGV